MNVTSRFGRYRVGLVLLVLGFVANDVESVLFYSTDDPAYNTTAPAGALAGSGWQFQGPWGAFLGTPIAPSYFITAGHVGGSVGDRFLLGGAAYTTAAFFDDPDSDLRIWRVCGTFPAVAPLYTGSNEAGKPVVVFGRGTTRGAAVQVTTGLTTERKGWQWGTPDHLQRWGENQVDSVVDGDGIGPFLGGGGERVGLLLKIGFNAGAGPNEAHLSGGDSGGAVFIQDGGTWKLAGINYSVDGPYNTNAFGTGFGAAIFDEGGLYKGGEGRWVLTPDLPVDVPGAFYATRISSNLDWINNVISVSGDGPILQSAADVSGPYTDVAEARVDPGANIITAPRNGGRQFYRLRDCVSHRITSVQVEPVQVMIAYE